ncbi:hypothetical protein [Paracoccus seriniphilus]|uniref:hypothetical protein n=1 Tax=Paracoccus seriniphilus TaxID=184748 RepID=UPI0035676E3A
MNQHAAAPEFAMSFTQEAVLLERREGLDWRLLGQVRFAGREMTDRLNALRRSAGDISGLSETVLVIPDDQILYTTLTVPVGADTAAAVGRALEAVTPYRAEDLAFDWCPSENGDIETLRVAAVARRTLEEAEEFARAQGFVPSAFVARPGDERFEGQPDFGLSTLHADRPDRPPFSEPDLSKARVTAPVIETPSEDEAPEEITLEMSPEPAAATAAISRVIAHHYPRTAKAPAKPVAATEDVAKAPAAIVTRSEPTPEPATRPEPPRAPAVIRHGDPKPGTSKRNMSLRAEAVHARAAEARARRADQAEGDQLSESALMALLRRAAPGKLTLLLGGLLVLLFLVLLVFGSKPAQTPSTAEPQAQPAERTEAPQEQAVNEPAALPTVSQSAAIPDGGVDGLASEAIAPDTGATQGVARIPEEAPDAEFVPEAELEAEASADVAQSPVQTADEPAAAAPPSSPSQDALTRALSEAIRTAAQTNDAGPENNIRSEDATENPDMATPDTASVAADVPPEAVPQSRAEDREERAPVAAVAAPAVNVTPTSRLRSSARPPSAPPTRTSAPARPDKLPTVPVNPLPFEQRDQPEPPRVSGERPPSRPARPAPAPTPAAAPAEIKAPEVKSVPTTARPPSRPARGQTSTSASAPTPEKAPTVTSSPSVPRPPERPASLTLLEEGSASEDRAPTRLTAAEEAFVQELMRNLRSAQAGASGLSPDERRLIRLADARPARRPVSVSRPSNDAVRAAVAEAVAASDRPIPRASVIGKAAPATAVPTGRVSGMTSSSRPQSRPRTIAAQSGRDPGPGNASLSAGAVEDAIAAAVSSSSATPGAVALTALRTSALPPRRSRNSGAHTAKPSTPTTKDLREAAMNQKRQAEIAEQRRLDAELQAQAEARARARAQADAQAEARARAQAEARARAQAQAEARAAAARKQNYTPPEAENEPEVQATLPTGRGQGSAAQAATVKDGIQLSRTQIIGTIGAGKASRALVRLSNGRIITLRLGDRINGGTITDIGDSRITYVKGGRPQQLSVLSGK